MKFLGKQLIRGMDGWYSGASAHTPCPTSNMAIRLCLAQGEISQPFSIYNLFACSPLIDQSRPAHYLFIKEYFQGRILLPCNPCCILLIDESTSEWEYFFIVWTVIKLIYRSGMPDQSGKKIRDKSFFVILLHLYIIHYIDRPSPISGMRTFFFPTWRP